MSTKRINRTLSALIAAAVVSGLLMGVGTAGAHVDYIDLNASGGTASDDMKRFGWIDGTDTDLGDSHQVSFFKFNLSQASLVNITMTGANELGLNPAFTLHAGLMGDLAHDDTAVDPNNPVAFNPVSGNFEKIASPVDDDELHGGEHFERAVEILADVVLRPDFPMDEGERLRRELLANLDELRDDDSGLLHRFFGRELYGDTPYGRPVAGTEESTMALSLPAAKAWHSHHTVRGNLVVGAAGAISGSEAESLLQRYFSTLPDGPRRDEPIPAPRARKAALPAG